MVKAKISNISLYRNASLYRYIVIYRFLRENVYACIKYFGGAKKYTNISSKWDFLVIYFVTILTLTPLEGCFRTSHFMEHLFLTVSEMS